LLTVRAHLWTIYPWLKERLRPTPAHPSAVPWSIVIDDRDAGPVRIRGQLHRSAGAKRAVVLVHGLGGGYESQLTARGRRWRSTARALLLYPFIFFPSISTPFILIIYSPIILFLYFNLLFPFKSLFSFHLPHLLI
jgi:hypothetical protein